MLGAQEDAELLREKVTWARLIRKVYESEPLECPKCKGPMRVIAPIDDPPVVRRILEHLGCWASEQSGPGPPAPACEWQANALIPLTPPDRWLSLTTE